MNSFYPFFSFKKAPRLRKSFIAETHLKHSFSTQSSTPRLGGSFSIINRSNHLMDSFQLIYVWPWLQQQWVQVWSQTLPRCSGCGSLNIRILSLIVLKKLFNTNLQAVLSVKGERRWLLLDKASQNSTQAERSGWRKFPSTRNKPPVLHVFSAASKRQF